MTSSIRLGLAAKSRVQKLRERQANPAAHMPVKFGLEDLEAILNGGLPKNDPFYIAIIGEDKKGKTTVGTQIAWAYAEATGLPTCLYNLEENLDQGADRAMTLRSPKVSRTDIYRNQLTEEDLDNLFLYADDIDRTETFINDELYSLEAIIADMREQGYLVGIIDNFQLLTDGRGRDLREKLSYLSQILMRARNDKEKPLRFFLLSQGNASGKSFGSNQVQQDADLCILIEERYEKEQKVRVAVPGIRVLKVTRCRFAGTGECEVIFQPQYSRVRTAQVKASDPDKEDFAEFESYQQPELHYIQEGENDDNDSD